MRPPSMDEETACTLWMSMDKLRAEIVELTGAIHNLVAELMNR